MPGPLGSVESMEAKRDRRGHAPDPRRDLLHYLAGEFAAGEPMRITGSEPDATGRSLTDRMVSRLEVVTALKRLPYRHLRVVELHCIADLPVQAVCERLRIGRTTLYRYREEALDVMIDAIYEWTHTEVA